MSSYILLATANATPAPGLGGIGVISPTNAGHSATPVASSAAGAGGFGSQSASCLWSLFTSTANPASVINIKFDWSFTGTLTKSGVGIAFASVSYAIAYSTNNGASFTNHVVRNLDRTTNGSNGISDSGSETISIPVSNIISQIQLRDFMQSQCDSEINGNASSVISPTIGGIRLEVVAQDLSIMVSM